MIIHWRCWKLFCLQEYRFTPNVLMYKQKHKWAHVTFNQVLWQHRLTRWLTLLDFVFLDDFDFLGMRPDPRSSDHLHYTFALKVHVSDQFQLTWLVNIDSKILPHRILSLLKHIKYSSNSTSIELSITSYSKTHPFVIGSKSTCNITLFNPQAMG